MKRTESNSTRTSQARLGQKVDEEFVSIMTEINGRYQDFNKHQRIRVEQWSKKLCQVTSNLLWKKNRNHYAVSLLDQIINLKLENPFSLTPPEGSLPSISTHQIKAKISSKFFKTGFAFLRGDAFEENGSFPLVKELLRQYEKRKEATKERSLEPQETKNNQVLQCLQYTTIKEEKKDVTPLKRRETLPDLRDRKQNKGKKPPFGININRLNVTEENISLNESSIKVKGLEGVERRNVTFEADSQNQNSNHNSRALLTENVRLKTEIQVLDITMKHLKAELERKTALSTKQAIEIGELRRELANKNIFIQQLQNQTKLVTTQRGVIPPLSLPVRSLGGSAEGKQQLMSFDSVKRHNLRGEKNDSIERETRMVLLSEEKDMLTRETQEILQRGEYSLLQQNAYEDDEFEGDRENNGRVSTDGPYSTNEMINDALQSIDDFDQRFMKIYSDKGL